MRVVKDASSTAQGQTAESSAARYLLERGYRLRERNFKTRLGEVDLIVERESTVAFVEVRYRRSIAWGSPEATVGRLKRRKLALAALEYVQRHRLENRPLRFDVLSISQARGRLRFEHHEGAFVLEDSMAPPSPLL
jgi:putative endonuclease